MPTVFHYLGSAAIPPAWTRTASQCPPGSSTSTAMGDQRLLLLLLFTGDGAFNLPGVITTWRCKSDTTTSTSKETTMCSDASSALANIKRDNTPAGQLNTSVPTRKTAMAESQNHTTPAAISASPPAYSSAGSSELSTPMHNPQEEILHTVNITVSKDTTLSNSITTSTLKDQGRTALSTIVTSDETSKQNQRASTAAPLASSPTTNVWETSVSTDSQKSSTITAPTALYTPGNDVTSPVSMATTISKKSPTTISPTTLNKITDVKGSFPMTTSAVIHTASPTLTTLGTTVPRTTMSESQEGETTDAPPTPTIAPTMSMLSETHRSITTQTPSRAVESAPSAGTAIAQSPKTTAAHSVALIPSSSGTTKSSAMTGASQASPKLTQASGSGAGACASDEYVDGRRVCMCSDSYYAHSAPTSDLALNPGMVDKATYHFVKESCPVSHRLLWGLRNNGASLEVTLAFKLLRLNSDVLFYLQ